MQVTQSLPFSTTQQHIYCLIMQSHELNTTKPTNQYPGVIFPERMCVSKGVAVISTPAGEKEGVEIRSCGKFHLQHLSVVASPCNYKHEQCVVCL